MPASWMMAVVQSPLATWRKRRVGESGIFCSWNSSSTCDSASGAWSASSGASFWRARVTSERTVPTGSPSLSATFTWRDGPGSRTGATSSSDPRYRFGPEAAQPVDGDAECDAAQPRPEAGRIDQQVEVTERAYERLLAQVLALGQITDQRGGQERGLALVAPNQLVARARVALARHLDKLGVRPHGHSLHVETRRRNAARRDRNSQGRTRSRFSALGTSQASYLPKTR